MATDLEELIIFWKDELAHAWKHQTPPIRGKIRDTIASLEKLKILTKEK